MRALGRAGCRTFFVAHLGGRRSCPDSLPGRDGVRAERLPAGHVRRLRALRSPAGPGLAGGARRVGGLLPRRGREAPGRASRRHGHEPARAVARRGPCARGRPAPRRLHAGAPDEPSRQRRGAGRPDQRAPDRAPSREVRAAFPAPPGFPRQLVRHLPARGARPRPRSAGLRPLRRQPDARASRTRCARWCGSKPA